MTQASDSSNDTKIPDAEAMLELLLEAARRANWDALRGPRHLRSGKYMIAKKTGSVVSGAARQDVEPDGSAPSLAVGRRSSG